MKTIILSLLILCGFDALSQSITTTTVTGSLKINDSLNVTKNIKTNGELNVIGISRLKNDVFLNRTLNISNNFGLKYTPASGSAPAIVSFSPFSGSSVASIIGKERGCSTFGVSIVNSFSDLVQVYNTTGTTLSMGVLSPSNEGVISLEGTNTSSTGTEELSINPRCSNNINMCFGGGFVSIAKNLEVGLKVRNSANAFSIYTAIGITKAISIEDPLLTSANKEVFNVARNGQTNIGLGRPLSTGIAANAMLSVDGLILAKEIRVALARTHWADYVFEKEYNLMPLNEVHDYIIKYSHLPEVPTLEEVKNNGIDVVEMNAILLKKIEELTLYIIDLKKEVEQIKSDK